ncbi:hypothetical protein ig2599ANME_2134 [groundwater metagenome]
MKFLVNMPLSPKTVKFLKNMGHEAVRVSELGMARSKDRDIFDHAEKNDMIILSAIWILEPYWQTLIPENPQ